MFTRNTTLRAGLVFGVSLFAANFQSAQAQQISFSLDWMSQTVGQLDSTYVFPITEGDVLVPTAVIPMFGPLMVPRNELDAGFAPTPWGLGLFGHAPCVGHLGGTPCFVEIDALSYGNEPLTGPGSPLSNNLAFSVDRHAVGLFSAAWPDVMSEAAFGDAPADLFLDLGLGVGPLAPMAAAFPGNVGLVDGNGMVSGSGATYMGVGLSEPSTTANPADNLDAFAIMGPPSGFPVGGVYYSLDDNFQDPLTGIWNSGSAQAHLFTGGDVLHTPTPWSGPVLYAPANLLGLNLTGSLDDLDALILRDNGTPGYQPSLVPNDWMGGATDMLLFSVRRGSAVIGRPDSFFGIPIVEGDILTTPLFGSPNPNPAIYVAAENLGLLTMRAIVGAVSDDLDALGILAGPINDCNGNGVEDAIDISMGFSWDINNNGVPDECELLTRGFCYCGIPSVAPCGNFYSPGGCQNSTGFGAILTASGTTSVTNDNLVLSATGMPLNRPGLLMMSKSANSGIPYKDGILCLNPQIFRYTNWALNSGATGSFNVGPGLINYCTTWFGAPGQIWPGNIWNFQVWYRDPWGPCLQKSNVTNAIEATFTP